MRLHRMASNVGIIANVGIVEVGDTLLVVAHDLVERPVALDASRVGRTLNHCEGWSCVGGWGAALCWAARRGAERRRYGANCSTIGGDANCRARGSGSGAGNRSGKSVVVVLVGNCNGADEAARAWSGRLARNFAVVLVGRCEAGHAIRSGRIVVVLEIAIVVRVEIRIRTVFLFPVRRGLPVSFVVESGIGNSNLKVWLGIWSLACVSGSGLAVHPQSTEKSEGGWAVRHLSVLSSALLFGCVVCGVIERSLVGSPKPRENLTEF